MEPESKDPAGNDEQCTAAPQLVIKRHVQFFKRTLNVLPSACQSLDASRMTLLFFAVSGLDVLNALDSVSTEERQHIIEWVYAQQILPDANDPDKNIQFCGFRGSSYLGAPFDTSRSPAVHHQYDCSHIAMTYTAMATLLILGDDLSRVNKPAILRGLRKLQLPDGSFCSTAEGSEHDMRFIYCACCVSHILNDWSGFDIEKAVEYIKDSQNYDCGIGQGPFLESHGGSTFCAVASLALMRRLEEAFPPPDLEGLKRWCIMRQQTGFQGRPNKPVDTCYSFWIGASLELLGCLEWVDKKWNRGYVLSTQGEYTGGFSKWPDTHPDPLHSYLGLCGLSIQGEGGLRPLCVSLNITQRAADWLEEIHAKNH